MDAEKVKVNKFFDEFINIVRKKKLAMLSIVIWVVLLLVGSSIPIQDIVKDIEEFKLFILVPMAMSVFGMFAAYMRISPYETYTEGILMWFRDKYLYGE